MKKKQKQNREAWVELPPDPNLLHRAVYYSLFLPTERLDQASFIKWIIGKRPFERDFSLNLKIKIHRNSGCSLVLTSSDRKVLTYYWIHVPFMNEPIWLARSDQLFVPLISSLSSSLLSFSSSSSSSLLYVHDNACLCTISYFSYRETVPVIILTNRFHVAVCLCNNRSQETLKWGLNKTWHTGRSQVCHWCDLPQNIRTATWNLFVLYNKEAKLKLLMVTSSRRLPSNRWEPRTNQNPCRIQFIIELRAVHWPACNILIKIFFHDCNIATISVIMIFLFQEKH